MNDETIIAEAITTITIVIDVELEDSDGGDDDESSMYGGCWGIVMVSVGIAEMLSALVSGGGGGSGGVYKLDIL